jgi:uncharacterized protein (TIGR03437 family)
MGGLAALAQSPGKFVATGEMTTPRGFHAATLLKDGRILITGGYHEDALGKSAVLASAELYDPSTGTFTPTGDMTTPRQWHSATLLIDGRVLIAGGNSPTNSPTGSSPVSSSELYDPATGIFTQSGDMIGPHSLHSANLLGNGKVLITGDPTAELYDPAKGVFSLAGSANNDGSTSTVLLKDGRILIPGMDGVSLYDIADDSLRLVARLPGRYYGQTTTVLANGKVLIAGGISDSEDGTLNEASLYDPHGGTLRSTGLMLFSRDIHTATLLADGHVLIVGGYDGDAYDTGVPVLTDGEDYDPSTGSFTSAGSLVHLREGHTATLLSDGRVLIAGGGAYHTQTTAELYIPPLRAVSIAGLTGRLAPESLASLFGSRLAVAAETADPLSPPTSLGGISLRLIDSAGLVAFAPLLYVSPAQIIFKVPAATAGEVTLEVVNAPAPMSRTTIRVENIAPTLFAYDDNTAIAYALRVEPNGKQTVLSVLGPIVLDNRPVYLVLYATGIRNRSSLANVQFTIGGIRLPVQYAGPEGSSIPGLDQVNVLLTSSLKGTGIANLVVTVDGISSNAVSVDIR